MIDLHIHSTASDGSFNPLEILALADRSGVKAVSITDHDTIDGIKEIIESEIFNPVEIISGVEISCQPPDPSYFESSSLHILGYGFSIYDQKLNQTLLKLKESRMDRNPKIIKKLNDLGFDFSIEDVENHFNTKLTGRPHIAEYMKEKGYVQSFKQAFDKYLAKGKPAYVDKYKISCQEAIEVIHGAGGISILAHPGLISMSKAYSLGSLVDELTAFGLGGLEVYYPEHSLSQTKEIKQMADDKNLIITGGSDFHGSFNEGIELGSGKGDLKVEYNLLENLKAAVEQLHSDTNNLNNLEANMGYTFNRSSFLKRALCHRSYLNENQQSDIKDNERLEFLGDAVLGLCVAQSIMEKCPEKHEGDLSKLRASLVSEIGLADMARQIDLGRYIRLGKGEMLAKGYEKKSILSDTFEAVIGAIYLDAGFDIANGVVKKLFEEKIALNVDGSSNQDYKSMLQEYAQEAGNSIPVYEVLNQTGPDHDKTFEISLKLFDITAKGLGKTKKAAEQDSAKNALKVLKKI